MFFGVSRNASSFVPRLALLVVSIFSFAMNLGTPVSAQTRFLSCRMTWSTPHDTPGYKMRLAFDSSAKWYHVQTWLVKDEPHWGLEEFWNEMGIGRSTYRFTAFFEQHRTKHPVMRADLLIDRDTGRAREKWTNYSPFRHLTRVSEAATGKCVRKPRWNYNPFEEADNPFEKM